MHNPCELLLLQNLNEVDCPCLWLADENISTDTLQQIHANSHLQVITNRYDAFTALEKRGLQVTLNDFDLSGQNVAKVIYRVSKERSLVQHCIIESVKHLENEGQLILFGEKKDGIKTHRQFAEQIFKSPASYTKQGLCYTVEIAKSENSAIDDFPDTQYTEIQKLSLEGLSFFSKPGIFGWQKIDSGSRLLIDTVIPQLTDQSTESKTLLDLGCGYGYLSVRLKTINFKQRFATDNNFTAVQAAVKNFSFHDLDVSASVDDCAKKLSTPIDILFCNPPFHQGFVHDHDLIHRFVQQSLKLLSSKGKAYFVVNEFVPLPRAAEACKGQATLLAHARGFKIYEVSH